MKRKQKKATSDELDADLYLTPRRSDLLDLRRRGKKSIARRKQTRQKLARLLGIDLKKEVEELSREHNACIQDARKRLQQLKKAEIARIKKAPSLMQQIQRMISR